MEPGFYWARYKHDRANPHAWAPVRILASGYMYELRNSNCLSKTTVENRFDIGPRIPDYKPEEKKNG